MTTLAVAIAAGTVVFELKVAMSTIEVEVLFEVTPVANTIEVGLVVVVIPVCKSTFVVMLMPVPSIIVGLLKVEEVVIVIVGLLIVEEVIRAVVGLLIVEDVVSAVVGLDTVTVAKEVVEDLDVVGTSTTMDVDKEAEVLFEIADVVDIVVGFNEVVAISITDTLLDMDIVSISVAAIDTEAIGSISAQTLPASKANAVRDIGKCIAVV